MHLIAGQQPLIKSIKCLIFNAIIGNGWCCYYQTMELCYNRQTGHGGGWVGWTRGSRIIELSYDNLWGQFTNYVRLENGTIIDQFPRKQ